MNADQIRKGIAISTSKAELDIVLDLTNKDYDDGNNDMSDLEWQAVSALMGAKRCLIEVRGEKKFNTH